MDVFVCRQNQKAKVKIQLELPQRTLEAYKAKAKGTVYSPKQVMENMLVNWADGSDGK